MDEMSLQRKSWRRVSTIPIWVTILVLALAFSGCKKDSREAFIQGVWYNNNAHLANIPAESAQVTNWEFDNHYFEVSSCCFIESYFSGNYSIADKGDGELTLDLFNMKGQNGGNILNRDDTASLVIKIDEESGVIWINGDGPYTLISR